MGCLVAVGRKGRLKTEELERHSAGCCSKGAPPDRPPPHGAVHGRTARVGWIGRKMKDEVRVAQVRTVITVVDAHDNTLESLTGQLKPASP
jgi:hypothetical protein